ncbi:glycosyltransferase family 2 protein [Paenibacillus sp. GCM10023248]|uniref:glycosyltransferase family 2 protein n=1 Tax=Bacillales TaxID=1385 RepID=UPI0023783D85|nr:MULTISPECIES: glycosyltransferase family 2 protein [Bacillales]MDD9269961.1 glycosyltransferase family 2 protein [Paenibacillus sp. MAHUQ-63]MDR6883181.1 glycosyltransferase involved in cell wall biosynthesis [Bacillus sp. 3255]
MKKRVIRKSLKPKAKPRYASKPLSEQEKPKVSVIIPAMNESKTLASVIRQAQLVHPFTEVIVVCNGSTDGTENIARRMGARVISFKESLGHDVGRSIGAMHARGDILLFTDADIVIPARDLKPFVYAVERGVDVALNSYTGKVLTDEVHPVVLAKHALNLALSRPDLRGASMTTIPHALSRRALEQIDAKHLSVPPLAQTIAVRKGLDLHKVHEVNVGRMNPRKRKAYKVDPLRHLIIGDHLEAIEWLLQDTNERGLQTDLSRDRSFVG